MFADGSYFEKEFQTEFGSITVFAQSHIFTKHLVLDELLFYPTESLIPLAIGARQTFAIFRALRVLAKEHGFSELTVVFHRTGPRRHGRTIAFTRRLI